MVLPTSAHAQGTNWSTWLPDTEYRVERLANAIFWAEGGYKTKWHYGIRSVKCMGGENGGCREVCKRTIRNNIKRYKSSLYEGRHANNSQYKSSYLKFLQSRYCPLPKAGRRLTTDEERLNGNWLRLVKYFFDKNKPLN